MSDHFTTSRSKGLSHWSQVRQLILSIAVNFIDSHLAYVTNKDLKKNWLSENAKTTLVRPIHKKDDEKYRSKRQEKTDIWTKEGKILVEMINKHYINIVKKTSGIAPKDF